MVPTAYNSIKASVLVIFFSHFLANLKNKSEAAQRRQYSGTQVSVLMGDTGFKTTFIMYCCDVIVSLDCTFLF